MKAKSKEKLLVVVQALGQGLAVLGETDKPVEARAREFMNTIQPALTRFIVEEVESQNRLVGAIVAGVINPVWDLYEPALVEVLTAWLETNEGKPTGGGNG